MLVGNMKNRRDVCYAKDAGYIEFNGYLVPSRLAARLPQPTKVVTVKIINIMLVILSS